METLHITQSSQFATLSERLQEFIRLCLEQKPSSLIEAIVAYELPFIVGKSMEVSRDEIAHVASVWNKDPFEGLIPSGVLQVSGYRDE